MLRNDSCECSKSEIDLLSVPPTMTVMNETQWIEYHPIASIEGNQAPLEFVVPAHADHFLDLSQSQLYLKFKLTKSDGTNLEADTKVVPVNNFMHSMFSNIDLYVNNKLITSSMDTYPYRAYLETLLSYGHDTKTHHLAASDMWYVDQAGKMTDTDVTANDSNTGLLSRYRVTSESKSVEMMSRLRLDLCMQDKYLLNGCELRFRLNRASPNFCLFAAAGVDTPKIKLEAARLFIRQVQLQPKISNDIQQLLKHTPAKYPIRRAEVKTFTIGTGMRSKIEDHLFQGQLPKRVFIGMVTNQAFNGNINANPFMFHHFNLSKLEVSCDGHAIHSRAFEPDFGHDHYLRSYMSVFQALGAQAMTHSPDITYEDYKNGFTFWGFDLTPDQGADEGHQHPIRTGNLRVELQFAEALPTTVNVIAYAEFDSQIEINNLREVITDF